MARRARASFLPALLTALAFSAVVAAGADAAPAWKFESKALESTESVAGTAASSALTVFGMTTTCDLSYLMEISNSAGTAAGLVTEMTFSNCVTDDACTVEVATAEALPWSLAGKTVGSAKYVVFKGIKFEIRYGGDLCVLEGVEAFFTGTAGGKYDNAAAGFAFSPANFTATGTQVKALGEPVSWTAFFTTEALGGHKGQVLELS